MKIPKPPLLSEEDLPSIIKDISQDPQLLDTLKQSVNNYDYWTKVKEQYIRLGYNPVRIWQGVKFLREVKDYRYLSATDINGQKYKYVLTDKMLNQLKQVERDTAGKLKVSGSIEIDRQKYLVSSLIEEAIASSQLEGAATTRKVAKNMIISGRKPRDRSERMILNNYRTMESILKWKDLDMSRELLLSIQELITPGTLEDPNDIGRFRSPKDKIKIWHEDVVLHTPPEPIKMHKDLDAFIAYANSPEEEETFSHALIKASVLHYWLAYIHPFCDGNGRTARAVFYWYMLKQDYWLFKYLSVSLTIKKSAKQYTAAFLKTQYDDNDLGYFLNYSFDTVQKSILKFHNHLDIWTKQLQELQKQESKLINYNQRQAELLKYLYEHPDSEITIKIHQFKQGVVYQTARTDILELVERGLLYVDHKRRRESVYRGATKKIEQLFM